MNLHGWKQLALWSIEYSCLTDAEKETAFQIFRTDWEKFCKWIIDEFGAFADALDVNSQ